MQIEAAADYATAVTGADGLLYKHVAVTGFPYPFVIPVSEAPQAWDDQRSTSYSTTLSEFSATSAEASSETSNTSAGIISGEPVDQIDHIREPPMGCNDPVFRVKSLTAAATFSDFDFT